MSCSNLFSFSDQPGGYFISDGNTMFAKSVPATLITAITEAKLYDIKSISIAPNGGWVACYHETAVPAGGPHGDNYFGEQVPKPLETYLEAHAHEDKCNPLHWVKMGPQEQWFARRLNSMDWQLMPPIEAAMLKLQKLGVQRKLQELVFGPANTAIFILSDGLFMWDLPLDSEEHSVLQQHYAMGTHLEFAALSFTDPGDYFFQWGKAGASYKVQDSEHARITGMVETCNATRMQTTMSQQTRLESAGSYCGKHTPSPQKVSNSHYEYQENTKGCDENGGIAAFSHSAGLEAEGSPKIQEVAQIYPRQGSGNLRLWPAGKLVPAAEL